MTLPNVSTYPREYLSERNIPKGWMEQSQVADEIKKVNPNISKEWVSLLLSAASSGLPLLLSTDDGRDRIVIVTSFNIDTEDGIVNVAYWGFAHGVHLSQIVTLESIGNIYNDSPISVK